MADNCGGMDAFTTLLEQYTEEVRKNGHRDGERDEARESTRAAIESVRGLQRQLSARQAQDNRMESVNKTLVETRAAIVGGRDFSPELIERLKKAIEDTDEIPF